MDSIVVKVNVSDNPWLSSYKEFSFCRKKIEVIAKDLVAQCAGKDYTASYAYGKHVSFVMEKAWDSTCGSILPLYKALLVVLRELQEPDEGWHGGATAAIRCIESRMAYATPGFIETKRYSELYGS